MSWFHAICHLGCSYWCTFDQLAISFWFRLSLLLESGCGCTSGAIGSDLCFGARSFICGRMQAGRIIIYALILFVLDGFYSWCAGRGGLCLTFSVSSADQRSSSEPRLWTYTCCDSGSSRTSESSAAPTAWLDKIECSLNIDAAQLPALVLIDFSGDANSLHCHHSVLFCSLGGTVWIAATPDLSVQCLDLGDHRVVVLQEAAPFPLHRINEITAADPDGFDDTNMIRLR